jgi:hypothetical protein
LGILEHSVDQFPAEEIPEINASAFTAYLCRVPSSMAPMKPAIMAEVDTKYPGDNLI